MIAVFYAAAILIALTGAAMLIEMLLYCFINRLFGGDDE